MPDLLIADDLEIALGKDFGEIPQVRHVLAERVGGPLLVWIAVDKENHRLAPTLSGISSFARWLPEIDFDFNLVPALGRGAQELASGAHVVFSRQE
jgi:hypothetical protein